MSFVDLIKAAQKKNECVILLHGLARSRYSLLKLEILLSKHYHVINKTYPSRKYTIEELAKMAIEPILKNANKHYSKIHFVTHSLGGILVREYLSQHEIKNLGNVVMLGPPNQGSELVDFFQQSPALKRLYRIINGPAGTQLGTNSDSRPIELGSVNFKLGVIAGSKNRNPLFSRILPGESDGKVSVSSSKVEGMTEHLVLPVDHTFMMLDEKVIMQIEHFLEYAEFKV